MQCYCFINLHAVLVVPSTATTTLPCHRRVGARRAIIITPVLPAGASIVRVRLAVRLDCCPGRGSALDFDPLHSAATSWLDRQRHSFGLYLSRRPHAERGCREWKTITWGELCHCAGCVPCAVRRTWQRHGACGMCHMQWKQHSTSEALSPAWHRNNGQWCMPYVALACMAARPPATCIDNPGRPDKRGRPDKQGRRRPSSGAACTSPFQPASCTGS